MGQKEEKVVSVVLTKDELKGVLATFNSIDPYYLSSESFYDMYIELYSKFAEFLKE